MLGDKSPIFENGRVLKVEMLEALRDYPRQIMSLLLKPYSDGVLTGCEIKVAEGYLVVMPGIICYHQNHYFLNEPVKLSYESNERLTFLRVRFGGQETSKDYRKLMAQIYLTEAAARSDELELARFKLKKQAKLRCDYVSFEDFNTEYDVINIIHVPFAAYEESTISPQITAYFLESALKMALETPLDLQFVMALSNAQGQVRRKLLTSYLSIKLKEDYAKADNFKIYQGLLKALDEIKEKKIPQKTRSNRLLYVD